MVTTSIRRIALSLCLAGFISTVIAAHPDQVTAPEPQLPQGSVDWMPTLAPEVTAAGADWQIQGEPVWFSGNWYSPVGPNVFFNGLVMIRSGAYRGVSLYVDATMAPFSVVYLPIGGHMMRPYVRRPDGQPVGAAGVGSGSFREEAGIEPSLTPARSIVRPVAARSAVRLPARRPSRQGIWIAFDGSRWYSAGPAVAYEAEGFALIGWSRGFPVYRDNTGTTNRVYIPSVENGSLAPFSRDSDLERE